MKKKKLLALGMVAAMATTAVVGGTLAYFTDSDTATNTFTVGGVEIDLVEKDKEGNTWTETELMPGEGNAVVKDVTVKNVGPNDAFMWAEIWIPSELDDGDPTLNAAKNNLHWNNFNTYKDKNDNIVMCRKKEADAEGYKLVAETQDEWIGRKTVKKEGKDVSYSGYRLWIKEDTAKAKDESTYSLLYRTFMDQHVTQCTDTNHESNCLVLQDGTTHYTGSWEIIVNAFGIQSQGLTDQNNDNKVTVEDAILQYDGNGKGEVVFTK